MTLTTAQWPFLPAEQRTPEQDERWWQGCYLRPSVEVTLRGVEHSVIISGGRGSGKSVALRAFQKFEGDRLLMIPYPVSRWPGEPHAYASGYGHLGQIMACASIVVKDFISAFPHKVEGLSNINLEYLRWLIEKYGGKRAFHRWADAIGNSFLLDQSQKQIEDFYPTDTDPQDVDGQIEELVTLSQRLGFEGVAVLVDVNQDDSNEELLLDNLKRLFGWLTPLQHKNFAVKAAVPTDFVERGSLVELTRGRVSFARLIWEIEECHELAHRYLRVATDDQLQSIDEIASAKLRTTLEANIDSLYGGPSPQGRIFLIAVLLNEYARRSQPLHIKQAEDLLRIYFAGYVPLKLDRVRQGIWRGPQFIELDEQPFRFLEVLWQYRKSNYEADEALMDIAVTRGNLNTIASRLRREIEPAPQKPVYIQNTRAKGYWLENAQDMQ